MDFVFDLPKDAAGNTRFLVFVDRMSKKLHLAAIPDNIYGVGIATLFMDRVFRQHGLTESSQSEQLRCSWIARLVNTLKVDRLGSISQVYGYIKGHYL